MFTKRKSTEKYTLKFVHFAQNALLPRHSYKFDVNICLLVFPKQSVNMNIVY